MTLMEAYLNIKCRVEAARISDPAKKLLLTAIEESNGFRRQAIIAVAGWPDAILVGWETEIWQLFRDNKPDNLARYVGSNRLPVTIGAGKAAYRPLMIRVHVTPQGATDLPYIAYIIGHQAEVLPAALLD